MTSKQIILKFLQLLLVIASINNASAQMLNKKHSISILLDNDYLNTRGSGTDRYYTNGIRIDFFYAKKQKTKFPSSLLLNISDNNTYGWGIAQFMFTPKNIALPDIQYNDRPYAGALYGIHSLQSIDNVKKVKVNSQIFLGVLGPLSFSKETQTWVHRAINSTIPQGWDNQLPTDLILNYNINIEKEMLSYPKAISLNVVIETFIGTLYNAAGVGYLLKVGRFNNFFDDILVSEKSSEKRFQLYLFMKPVARVVLSNATLQGGLLNRNIEYAMGSDQLERLTVIYNIGVVCELAQYGSILLNQRLLTPEFKGQYNQEVGSITIQLKL